jgi:DNA-directed RNA polymerase subunit N (RpoN/RPB10)
MAVPVRCDICGKLFSSRHLSSHKRLAHRGERGSGEVDEQQAMGKIIDLFGELSEENKKQVLDRLTPKA